MEKTELDELLTVQDIMDYFNISYNKVYSLMKVKGFPNFRIGRTYYIPKKEFISWVSDHATKNINILLK